LAGMGLSTAGAGRRKKTGRSRMPKERCMTYF
jgi:hypothetical protein